MFELILLILSIQLTTIIGVVIFYKDYINFKYAAQAKEIVNKPKKKFIIPGSGVFTIRDKRKAVINDDVKAFEIERDSQ